MAEFNVNKGIGRSPEFKGLKSQYLFIFAGGLLALFVIFVVMYMAGIDQWVCIGFGVVSASVLVWGTFRMNSKYGEWGLMKLHALRSHPRYIINRRNFLRLMIIVVPIGAEESFKGLVDLIKMKAIYWHDETMGADYTVEEIPANLVETRRLMKCRRWQN